MWWRLNSFRIFDVFGPAVVVAIQQGKQPEASEAVKNEKTESALRVLAAFIWMLVERDAARFQNIEQYTIQRYHNNRASGKRLK